MNPVNTSPANRRPSSSRPARFRALPASVWALGLGSMFMDSSSELIHSLLPLFLSMVLGASMTTIGLIEGVAEATAAITKLFSGVISDRLGKRKPLVILGYGLAAATKPIFPLASSIGWVFGARFVDRIGKGIRGAPRDALVADITPPDLRGAAYGLRQSLDSVGAIIGPLLAVLFMTWFSNDIRRVLWVAVVPAVVAVALLVVAVREPEKVDHAERGRTNAALTDIRALPLAFWLVVLVGAIFTLARFSEAFLVLRARDAGVALGHVPVVMIVMNVLYAGGAYPAGVAADRVGARSLLVAGLSMLIAADLVLAGAGSPSSVFIGAALWGLHMGLTQGLFSKLVADVSPAALRGTAFGIFNLVSGVALLLASLIAGALWSAFGAEATFRAGATFATLAALGVLAFRGRPRGS